MLLLRSGTCAARHQMLVKRLRLQFRSISCTFDQISANGFARLPRMWHPSLLKDIVPAQILARRLAVHSCFHCTRADGSSLVTLVYKPDELGSCDHNSEAAPATPTGVKLHAASTRKTSPSMSDFNCHQNGIVIVVAQPVPKSLSTSLAGFSAFRFPHQTPVLCFPSRRAGVSTSSRKARSRSDPR